MLDKDYKKALDYVHKQNMRGNNDSARRDGLPNIAQPDIEPGITEEDLADHIELEDMQTTPVDKGKAREKPSDPVPNLPQERTKSQIGAELLNLIVMESDSDVQQNVKRTAELYRGHPRAAIPEDQRLKRYGFLHYGRLILRSTISLELCASS